MTTSGTESAFDLVVVGGGIAGAGLARLAARNGLEVALLERGDLASGTSSASSHMLHGGLRYLEHGRLGLVRESLHERGALVRMAPGLAAERRFLIPHWRGARLPAWKVRLGLRLYDALAGRGNLERHATATADAALGLEPDLDRDGLLGASIYSDAVMDDAGLVVAVARDAAEHGAMIHPGLEATAARPAPGGLFEVTGRETAGGGERRFTARAVVNAAGPWVDAVRRRLLQSLVPGSAPPPPLLRPSRGSHLVYPALTRGHGLLLGARSDHRALFVVPMGEHSLVGTTEIEVATPPPPEALEPDREELAYLARELVRALPGARTRRPLAALAGVRPLLGSGAAVGRASREHRVIRDGPLFTLAGGKYTTFRAQAREALREIARFLGRPAAIADPEEPLPAPPPAGAPVAEIAAFAVERAFARGLDDVVRRRTRLWMDPDRARALVPALADEMARRLGWSDARRREELERFEEGQRRQRALLSRLTEGT